MDKAPDAFRTISEVADELDIPQHVLRFWETRFTHIKPMKRSGGRRFYRPDDVDLLRGIRRLLYTEGYTIRGVQRILKEQGVKAVQTVDAEPREPSSAAAGARPMTVAPAPRKPRLPAVEPPPEARPEVDYSDFEGSEDNNGEGPSIVVTPPLPKPFTTPLPSLELRPNSIQTVGMVPRAAIPQDVPPPPKPTAPPAPSVPPSYMPDLTFETLMPARRAVPAPALTPTVSAPIPPEPFDIKRLQPVLNELMAVRRLLDAAMLSSEPAG